MKIFIKRATLTRGREYRLMHFSETPGSANTTGEAHFLINLPPYGGKCETTPLNGIIGIMGIRKKLDPTLCAAV